MKIMATCSACQRDLLLSQLAEDSRVTGRCPWCGTLLAPHYTLLLADTIRRAERARAELEQTLGQLSGDWARSHVRPESILDPLRAHLLEAEAAQQRLSLRRAA